MKVNLEGTSQEIASYLEACPIQEKYVMVPQEVMERFERTKKLSEDMKNLFKTPITKKEAGLCEAYSRVYELLTE